MLNIIFVDDEAGYRSSFKRVLKPMKGVKLITHSSGKDALHALKSFKADLVITDVMMPDMDGLSVLKHIKEHYPHVFVVVITCKGSIRQAVEAMKLGAYDYMEKPFDVEGVRRILNTIINHRNILSHGDYDGNERRQCYRFENIIGQDKKMFDIYETISQVASTNASVLIMGESGTGKERIAEAIHFSSPRRQKPFIKVNCAALTETLINSELFGHEKGAFTGAHATKKGHFELADQGTIFLDEIGDITLNTQIALLRVLDLGCFQRVGGTRTINVDTRLICATHQDLFKAMDNRRFREDLYYRINVVSIGLPPLRERKMDIGLLSDYFIKISAPHLNKNVTGLSSEALAILQKYHWPGNVRELSNTIERALIFAKGESILPGDLPESVRSTSQSNFSLTLSSPTLYHAEQALITRVLVESGWNLKLAAETLGIARGTLYSKMKKLSIERPE